MSVEKFRNQKPLSKNLYFEMIFQELLAFRILCKGQERIIEESIPRVYVYIYISSININLTLLMLSRLEYLAF